MDTRISNIELEIAGMKDDIAEMKVEIAGMKDDIAEMKVEIAGMKDDIAEMKAEIIGIKKELQEHKELIEFNQELSESIKNVVSNFYKEFRKFTKSNNIQHNLYNSKLLQYNKD
jgi:predicted  nucleic acid-binding Zn-ribbon protein